MRKGNERTARGTGKWKALAVLLVAAGFLIGSYPYDTDPSIGKEAGNLEDAKKFYDVAYTGAESGADSKYVETEKTAARMKGVELRMQAAVRQYGMDKMKVLEVGSGTGTLQDLVPDYTGLDLASSVRRYYHKPFVAASATAMPFPDNSFDAVWTIWVVEHIPEPERALMEMRRVLKPGGLLLLWPAWSCETWLSEGYEARPYRDFGIGGKIIKASIPVRQSRYVQFLSLVSARVMRLGQQRLEGGPTRLHFRALRPNYEKFWVADSDAAVSLDSYEAMQWFRSRGDECLNCGSDVDELTAFRKDLALKIRKPAVRVAGRVRRRPAQ